MKVSTTGELTGGRGLFRRLQPQAEAMRTRTSAPAAQCCCRIWSMPLASRATCRRRGQGYKDPRREPGQHRQFNPNRQRRLSEVPNALSGAPSPWLPSSITRSTMRGSPITSWRFRSPMRCWPLLQRANLRILSPIPAPPQCKLQWNSERIVWRSKARVKMGCCTLMTPRIYRPSCTTDAGAQQPRYLH